MTTTPPSQSRGESAFAPARSLKRSAKKGISALVTATLALGLVSAGAMSASAAPGDGGSGGVPGGNYGSESTVLNIYSAFYDDLIRESSGDWESPQGWGQSSIDFFTDFTGLGSMPPAASLDMKNNAQTACTAALDEANARAADQGETNPKSRVVGLLWAEADNSYGAGAERSAQVFYNEIDEWVADGYAGISGYSDTPATRNSIASLAREGVEKATGYGQDDNDNYETPYAELVCVALPQTEPAAVNVDYDLSITTAAQSTFATSGGTTGVSDSIYADNDGSNTVENVNANVILHWDGSADGSGATSITRSKSITNNGTTVSPTFYPNDFGWSAWPAGTFWFDVKVAKQGGMAAAVDTPDREPSETWTARYPMSITTTASGTFTRSNTTTQVRDLISASNGGSRYAENVDANVIMHWDGKGSSSTISRTKSVTIANNGDTYSPYFSPSDFGWTVWPAGKFWFDVQVSRQGLMTASVDTPDREPTETWKAYYPLVITTDAKSTFDIAGSTGAVSDTIHADNSNAGFTENVDANVIMHWDGVEGNPTSQTKTKSMTSEGDTTSPSFTPADFGWAAWPAGQFWFDVQVNQQGWMAASVDTPDRDSRETWDSEFDLPVKDITTGDPAVSLDTDNVLTSGMVYDARIAANTNGYASSLTISDTIQTDKVFIGSREADVLDEVYMTDPDGNAVSDATFTIDRDTAGKVTVSGTVENIPTKFTGAKYTLVVPTYLLPTLSDYTITDGSYACYADATMADPADCLEGNNKETYKVTPSPDKAWVLDETGALVTTDEEWSNDVGADNLMFLPGDAVSAVVNGRVPGKLASTMDNYQLVDDWTKAGQYVDFSDESQVHVYMQPSANSETFNDVTDQFDVTIEGTVTTVTAKKAFLDGTDNLSSDRRTKLVVSGKFRDDYDTEGVTAVLYNAGWEIYNNERIDSNEPPVYTWTPNPNKQVYGSGEQSGENTYEDIDGMMVYPGQKLEYSIGVDLNIPENTARGVKSLAVKDVFDPQFVPDKHSVEFWDSRSTSNPRPVSRNDYSIAWDDDAHTFVATFTQAWIDENVNEAGANSQWLTQGWLTMRFTGTVVDTATPGSVIQNQAMQIINDVETVTEVPSVEIPAPEPNKENLNTDLVNIDGKTVVEGDRILYRLTLDAGPAADQTAYYVHKLGMVDDYDEEYLGLETEDVNVVNQSTGADVTDAFNIQIIDGVLYVFAKTVDHVNPFGETILGDPQPEDLSVYNAATIDPANDPVIDQALLGHKYWITMDTVVTKETDGYVIENQATQNIENSHESTIVVSNPVKDIDPTKDVVVWEQTKDESLDASEIALDTVFNYRITSSELHTNRAYQASDWAISDTFDRTHDQFTGTWAAYTDVDLYDGDELLVAAGGLLADSAGHESEALKGLFDVTWDEEGYTLNVAATSKYLDLVNVREDITAQFSIYTQMVRIAPAKRIENVTTEMYNNYDRDSNVVWTSTTEHPAIAITKYTLDEGMDKGSRRYEEFALKVDADMVKTMNAKGGTDGVNVGLRIANTGDVTLQNVTLTDTTIKGTFGEVGQLMCTVPVLVESPVMEPTPVVPEAPGEAETEPEAEVDPSAEPTPELDDAQETEAEEVEAAPATQTIAMADVDVTLAAGTMFDCVGVLRGLGADQLHGDVAVVTGQSVFTDTEVSDEDRWYAKGPSTPETPAPADSPAVSIVKYTLDEGLDAGDRNTKEDAFLLDRAARKAMNDPEGTDGVEVGLYIVNTGDVTLSDVTVADETIKGTHGEVENIMCTVPAALGLQEVAMDKVNITLGEGESFTCMGTLRNVEADELHGDNATVTAASAVSGEIVSAEDPWFAAGERSPIVVTGQAISAQNNPWLLGGGLALLVMATVAGVAFGVGRKKLVR